MRPKWDVATTSHAMWVVSTTTRCVSISGFASLLGVPIGITSSTIGSKICAVTAGIKNISW